MFVVTSNKIVIQQNNKIVIQQNNKITKQLNNKTTKQLNNKTTKQLNNKLCLEDSTERSESNPGQSLGICKLKQNDCLEDSTFHALK